MPFITLAVTSNVVQQVDQGNDFQKQLAIRDASPGLAALIKTANAQNKVPVAVCGVFKLTTFLTSILFWRADRMPQLHSGGRNRDKN